jgi:FkbM family methyltransferase
VCRLRPVTFLPVLKRCLPRSVRRVASVMWGRMVADPNSYLKSCRGVIHVGANTGQERDLYETYGLDVLWIEPIPEVYGKLLDHLSGFDRQMAINYLITDQDDQDCTLHVANNNGASSSIFDLHQHRDIWPDVEYTRNIRLKTITLPTAMRRSAIKVSTYDALVLDTQGSELLVLRGAASLLEGFKYIKTEAADFESYKGCAKVADLTDYLSPLGFRLLRRDKCAERPAGGSYFDLLFKQR